MTRPPHLTDDQWLAQLQAAATATLRLEDVSTSGTSASLAARLPRAAQLAAGAAMPAITNPKIWQADARRFRRGERFARGPWQAACRAAVKARALGDVLAPTILRACEVLAWQDAGQQGRTQITFKFLAELTGCCVETARKVIRWLEDRGLIDTFNTLDRVGGQIQRTANLYVLAFPDAPPADPPAEAAPVDPIGRITARLARWASAFGLTPRAWGYNATPLRGRPAPA